MISVVPYNKQKCLKITVFCLSCDITYFCPNASIFVDFRNDWHFMLCSFKVYFILLTLYICFRLYISYSSWNLNKLSIKYQSRPKSIRTTYSNKKQTNLIYIFNWNCISQFLSTAKKKNNKNYIRKWKCFFIRQFYRQ